MSRAHDDGEESGSAPEFVIEDGVPRGMDTDKQQVLEQQASAERAVEELEASETSPEGVFDMPPLFGFHELNQHRVVEDEGVWMSLFVTKDGDYVETFGALACNHYFGFRTDGE